MAGGHLDPATFVGSRMFDQRDEAGGHEPTVDLHRKVSHVVALEHNPDAFRRVFGELEPEPISVAFEATYGWGWFADLLADGGSRPTWP